MSGGIRVIKVVPEMTPEQRLARARAYDKWLKKVDEAKRERDNRKEAAQLDYEHTVADLLAEYEADLQRIMKGAS